MAAERDSARQTDSGHRIHSNRNVPQFRSEGTASSSPTSRQAFPRTSSDAPKRQSLESSRSAGGTPKPARGSPLSPAPGSSRPRPTSGSIRSSDRIAGSPTTGTMQQASADAAGEDRSPHSSAGSMARRRPPPLEFVRDDRPTSTRHGSASPSAAFQKLSISSPANAPLQSPDRSSGTAKASTDPSESPVIETTIPSARLSLSHDFVLDRNETTAPNASHLASPASASSSSSALEQTSMRTRMPSSDASYHRSRWTNGTSGGLPFSVSAAANLSSFASATSPVAANRNVLYASTASASVSPRSPHDAVNRYNSMSPAVDRGQLVGLGELATPRWTSDVLERRWQSGSGPSTDAQLQTSHRLDTNNFGSTLDVDSPTLVRPAGRPHVERADSSFDNSDRPFGQASTASLLLPTSASTATLALDAAPLGLLSFGAHASPKRSEVSPSSPTVATGPPRRRTSTRRETNTTAASSSGAGSDSWTLSSPARPVSIGLGIVSDAAEEGASSRRRELSTSPARQRMSSSGAASTSSSRRSSGRPISLDSKTSGKALRRQSAGKGNFAHLPPSPAASSTSHTLATGPPADLPIPAMPALASFPNSPAASARQAFPATASASSTPPTRTPDHHHRQPRHSSSSHHSSPSVVAASILRQTREVEGGDIDIEEAAAHDEDTAAALARLDGLQAPRLSRIASGDRARKSSKPTSQAVTPPSRRASMYGDERETTVMHPSRTSDMSGLPLSGSENLATDAEAARRSDAPRQRAIDSADAAIASGYPRKRGSSSSASATGGSFSAVGSLDSTSATSYTTRSPASKYRRSSAGSDASLAQSVSESRPTLERQSSGGETTTIAEIPPVPPLPKDWETYRPSLGPGASTTLDSKFSPDAVARTSPRHSVDPKASPRAAQGPRASIAGPDVDGSKSEISNPDEWPAAGHSRRKWSISNAFHKATRSPKAAMKESTSFNDLQSAAGKHFRRSTNGQLGNTALPRRVAGSTSNLSTLSGEDAKTPTSPMSVSSAFGSLGRSSIRSGGFLRTRTTSYSGGAAVAPTHATPSIVTTSPSKSAVGASSSRRTPSGIPFFSRKTSSSSVAETVSNSTPSPKLESPTPLSDDKGGRKSILGLGFLRPSGSSSSKRNPHAIASQPSSSSRTMFSTSQSSLDLGIMPTVDEFGRSPSQVTAQGVRRSDVSTPRKRGKTLSSVESNDVFREAGSQPLPPLHMPALPPTTVHRLEALKGGDVASSSKSGPPRTRASRLQDSVKANLPTIAGSPSTTAGSTTALQPSETTGSTTPPPKSRTPTRIPRLNRTSANPTPRTSPSAGTTGFGRRLSSHGSLSSDFAQQMETTAGIANKADPHRSSRTRTNVDAAVSGIPRSRSTSSRSSIANLVNERKAGGGVSTGTSATPARGAERLPSLSASTSRLPSTTSSSTARGRAAAESANVVLPQVSKRTEAGPRRVSVPAVASTADLLSTSKSARTLSSKASTSSRIGRGYGPTRLSPGATDSGRSSSASGVLVNEDEIRGDEEMAAYARRQRTKRLASGMDANSVRKLFEFPEPSHPLPPLSANEALSLYSRYLTSYEKHEIAEYQRVYYVGPNCEKKPASRDNTANNFGYDDDRGDYLMVPHDHIQYRYEVIDVLGKGSFGQVLQCRDHKTGDMVAVKIIRNKKRFHHQALVEIKVLENLVRWDPDEKHFVIRMIDSFTFRGHLCIVTELLSINLYELVKANGFAGFSTTLIRRFTVQILACLSLLRHHRVVHCDLKPENILLRHPSKSGVKVIDFGSSCFENEKVYTYIQSRFYRSPEVILGQNYHMSIDMWSLGCIMAEMYTGYPIFPGENEQEQLACIIEVLGVPDKYLVDRSSRKRLFFDSTGAPRPVVNSKGRRRRPNAKTLAQILKTDDDLFVDFIAKCLAWDPDRRLKPDQAMRHPWIAQIRGSSQTASIPSRTNRPASLASGASSKRTSAAQPSTAAISTPQRLRPTVPSGVSTAPHPRVRTASTSAVSTSRTSQKTSLPAATRYAVRP